jgi:hypothetical protein
MDRELDELLRKYADGTVTDEERDKLRSMLELKENQRAVLSSDTPEAIFLAEGEVETPEWNSFWPAFHNRLSDQDRWSAPKPKWGGWVATAAAAVIVLALIIIPQFLPVENDEKSVFSELNYTLKHRQPAEILPRIKDYLGEDASINVDNATGTITIREDGADLTTVHKVLKALDRIPVELKFDLAIITSEGQASDIVRTVDNFPAGEFDISAYGIISRFSINPVEDRQFRTTFDDRYEITCFIRLNDLGTEAHIVSLTIYDLQAKNIILRQNDFSLAEGWTTTVNTGLKTDDDKPLLVAVTLPGDNE